MTTPLTSCWKNRVTSASGMPEGLGQCPAPPVLTRDPGQPLKASVLAGVHFWFLMTYIVSTLLVVSPYWSNEILPVAPFVFADWTAATIACLTESSIELFPGST